MRVFLVGDYRTGTGPANVTLEYKKRIPHVFVQRMKSKAARVPELFVKAFFSDVVLLSGHSRQNLYALRFARLWGRKCAFLMHGCVEYENEINGVPDADMTDTERRTLEGADAIFAVSEHFAAWLKERYPAYRDKISAVPNGADLEMSVPEGAAREQDKNLIFSIGGGMPRKRIRYIAQAVMLLRKDPACRDLKLAVAGDTGKDSEVLDAYPCVDDLGLISHERCMDLLSSCALFVQNSCFETFALSPLEALGAGASVLCSREVGALELFSGLQPCDVIGNTEDAEEIAGKIKTLLGKGNRDRLLSSIDTESVSWNKRCDLLMKKLQELTDK